MKNVLAIDQGTTSTKALLVNDKGQGKLIRAIKHKQLYPELGWVEHDPEEILQNIQLCIDSCAEDVLVGIDNQGESCLAWDSETKRPITPIIVWQDTRTKDAINHIKKEGREPTVTSRTGLPLDPYFSASKLGWIYENIPEAKKLHQRGKLRLGTTDAFFLDRLTGNFVTDVSTASRTSLMNIQDCSWDKELCDIFQVPMDTLPEIVQTTGDFGVIKSNGRYLPVTASVVDQQAALYGHGCTTPGKAKITFGTGAFVLAVTGKIPALSMMKGVLPTVAWQLSEGEVVYALDGGVYAAGSAINWAKRLGLFISHEQINSFTKGSAISKELVFVPALVGLGCPYWERSAGGAWFGLNLQTEPLYLVQAILESIAFRAAEVIEAMEYHCAFRKTISIDGGLAANPYLCQFLADVLQRNVHIRSSQELTAIGTAMLAGADTNNPDHQRHFKSFSPRDDKSIYLEKFKDAVSRTRHWHDKEHLSRD